MISSKDSIVISPQLLGKEASKSAIAREAEQAGTSSGSKAEERKGVEEDSEKILEEALEKRIMQSCLAGDDFSPNVLVQPWKRLQSEEVDSDEESSSHSDGETSSGSSQEKRKKRTRGKKKEKDKVKTRK